jgi:hypothetical protein
MEYFLGVRRRGHHFSQLLVLGNQFVDDALIVHMVGLLNSTLTLGAVVHSKRYF